MKVLIATGIYPPDIGGPATYSKLLSEELPKRGIEIEVLSFGEVRRLPKIVRHFAYFLKVLKRSRRADIIFAQDPASVGFPAALAAKILRKKFVLKIVGDYAWEQGMQRFGVKDLLDDFVGKKYNWKIGLLRKIQKFVSAAAFLIITPSKYLKKIVEKWKIDGNKIKVIYNAFEVPELNTAKEEARRRPSVIRALSERDFAIVSAGRLVPWKGFKKLIEIMPEILKEIPSAKLFIIGSGPEREALETIVANHGLRNNVVLLGRLPREELLLWLRAGDVFALNTGYEGFSHQLLEAMAAGIPVVTTDVGGNPEMITDGESGFLVGYNNGEELKRAIFEIHGNPEKKDRIIRNAKRKAREFGKERMLCELIGILKSLE